MSRPSRRGYIVSKKPYQHETRNAGTNGSLHAFAEPLFGHIKGIRSLSQVRQEIRDKVEADRLKHRDRLICFETVQDPSGAGPHPCPRDAVVFGRCRIHERHHREAMAEICANAT